MLLVLSYIYTGDSRVEEERETSVKLSTRLTPDCDSECVRQVFVVLQSKRRHQWLKIDDLKAADSGNYTCIVANVHGHITHTFYVDVYSKLSLITQLDPFILTAFIK